MTLILFSSFYLVLAKYLLFQIHKKLPEVPEFFKLRLLELLRWLVKSKVSGAYRTGSRKEKVEGQGGRKGEGRRKGRRAGNGCILLIMKGKKAFAKKFAFVKIRMYRKNRTLKKVFIFYLSKPSNE